MTINHFITNLHSMKSMVYEWICLYPYSKFPAARPYQIQLEYPYGKYPVKIPILDTHLWKIQKCVIQ